MVPESPFNSRAFGAQRKASTVPDSFAGSSRSQVLKRIPYRCLTCRHGACRFSTRDDTNGCARGGTGTIRENHCDTRQPVDTNARNIWKSEELISSCARVLILILGTVVDPLVSQHDSESSVAWLLQPLIFLRCCLPERQRTSIAISLLCRTIAPAK